MQEKILKLLELGLDFPEKTQLLRFSFMHYLRGEAEDALRFAAMALALENATAYDGPFADEDSGRLTFDGVEVFNDRVVVKVCKGDEVHIITLNFV